MTIEATNDAGYPAPIGLAADPVVFTLLDGRLSVLLARRLEEPQRGMFALPGGFVGAEESPEQTAERKLREKTGVGSVHLEQLRTYAAPDRDPRGWLPSIAYMALVAPGGAARTTRPPSATPAGTRRRAPGAGARPRADRRRRPLAPARPCRRQGVVRARRRRAAPRDVHARARRSGSTRRSRGEAVDPANFRRDVKATGLLADTGERRTEGPGRPGTLYRLRD